MAEVTNESKQVNHLVLRRGFFRGSATRRQRSLARRDDTENARAGYPDEYAVFKPLLQQKGLSPIIERTLGKKEKKVIYADGGKKTTRTISAPKEDRARFVLANDDILKLARWAVAIESH